MVEDTVRRTRELTIKGVSELLWIDEKGEECIKANWVALMREKVKTGCDCPTKYIMQFPASSTPKQTQSNGRVKTEIWFVLILSLRGTFVEAQSSQERTLTRKNRERINGHLEPPHISLDMWDCWLLRFAFSIEFFPLASWTGKNTQQD